MWSLTWGFALCCDCFSGCRVGSVGHFTRLVVLMFVFGIHYLFVLLVCCLFDYCCGVLLLVSCLLLLVGYVLVFVLVLVLLLWCLLVCYGCVWFWVCSGWVLMMLFVYLLGINLQFVDVYKCWWFFNSVAWLIDFIYVLIVMYWGLVMLIVCVFYLCVGKVSGCFALLLVLLVFCVL